MPARVVVIALDSYEQDLLLEWAAAGDLPVLGKLLQQATWGLVDTPSAVYAGAVWPSFNTGTSPAHHRRFFRRQATSGQYLDKEFKPTDVQGKPFWDVLSDAGRRVAIVDVPHSTLSERLNGIQVVDWATHEPELEQALTYPATLRERIVSRFGAEAPDRCEEMPHTPEGCRVLLAHLEARMRARSAMARHYLNAESWDFFIAVYSEAHCAGHQWWHLHDPTHPAHDAKTAGVMGDIMKEAYIRIDRSVGELLADVAADTRVMILCSHGMGPLYAESVVLDEVLRRLEPKKATSGSAFASLKRSWYLLPPAVRNLAPLRALRLSAQRSLHQALLVPDRQSRPFFAIPHNPHAGAIRINLAGRETHGIIRQGSEYRALCDELRREMLALKCDDTQLPAVEEVYIVADQYDGPFANELPDITVEWSRRKPMHSLTSPRIGRVPVPNVGGRTGDHTPTGLFLATGPGLKAQRVERSVSIVDFAPTFTAWLDVPTPPAFAGQPIPELVGK